jgi:hypothetical protein
MYATQWIKSVPARHSFTVDLEELANHPTRWDNQGLYQYNQIHFWSDVDIWKKKNKDVPSTVNTSTSTPVLSLPSPASTSEYKQNLDRWNKGKRDYTKYPILKDNADFTKWKDRYVTYAKTKHMGRMIGKNTKFKDLVDKHDQDLWNSQEQHMKLALYHALQTDVSKSIYQQYKSSPKGIWNHLVDHYSSTESSQAQSKKIIDKLQNLNIREYDTRVEFGTKLTQYIAQYDDVSTESLSSNSSIAYFENSIKSDASVTSNFNSWKTSFKLAKNKDPEFSDYKAKIL